MSTQAVPTPKPEYRYKGAVIRFTPDIRPEPRAMIFQHIRYWLDVSGAGVGNVYTMPVADPIRALMHARRRVLQGIRHQKAKLVPTP
jgi:hypothetical protein